MDNIAVSSGKTNASSFFNNNTTNNISFDSNNKISGNNVEKISNSFRQNLSDVESIDVLSNVNKNTILNTNSTDDMITRNGVLNSWISYIKTTLDDLVYQKQQTIENYYNKFNQTHFSDLIVNQETGEYLTPEEYKKSSETLESFLIQNGYPTSDGVDPDLYLKGVEAFNNYVDTEYTELFNKHFEEATGISYDEYVLKINTFDQDITNLKSNLYAFEQQAKEEPYLEMIETDEYKKFYEDNPDLLNEINSIYDSGMELPIVDDTEYNFYHNNSALNSNYVFLRNNVHIENLNDNEINIIRGNLLNGEELNYQFLISTFQKVFYESGNYSMFGIETFDCILDSDSLIFEFAFDQKKFTKKEQFILADKVFDGIKHSLSPIQKILNSKISFLEYKAIPDIYFVEEEKKEEEVIRNYNI